MLRHVLLSMVLYRLYTTAKACFVGESGLQGVQTKYEERDSLVTVDLKS